MTPRIGDWFLTYTGLQFYPLDPRPADITPFDIAHHLSLVCRFNGACRVFYSVAQHSCIVSDHITDDYKLPGLMHDATEAYCGDMVRPLKRSMPAYCDVEEKIWVAILHRFKIEWNSFVVHKVKEADNRALMTERRDLMNPSPHQWSVSESEFPPFKDKVEAWSPEKAEAEFLERFFKLSK